MPRNPFNAFARSLTVLTLTCALAGCIQTEPVPPTPNAPRPTPVLTESGRYQLTHGVTVAGVGAAQGIFAEGNFIYILGDLNEGGTTGPGVIREFFLSTGDDGRSTLRPSGRQILLTESGRDVATHPTGLTWHPNFGYWLGDTVDGVGRILQIDFTRALTQGTLDGCVLHTVQDDAAIDGTRPMFVTLPGGRVTLATGDYGDQANAIRLYDPLALLAADRTSTIGVMFSESACGPFVQSLASRGNPGELWLVQNQTEGQGYRLTEITMDATGAVTSENVLDFDRPAGELKGMLWRSADREGRIGFMLVAADQTQNVFFGRLVPEPRYVNPVRRQLDR